MAILKAKMVAPAIIAGVFIFFLALVLISAFHSVNALRDLPDSVSPESSFNVTVTFTSSADEFNSIGIHEEAPTSWNVSVDRKWCTPNADFAKADKNIGEYVWYGPYAANTVFTAIYRVSIPSDVKEGSYAFNGSVKYYIGEEGPYEEAVGGDKEVKVVTTVPSGGEAGRATPAVPSGGEAGRATPTTSSTPALTPTPEETPTLTPEVTPTPEETPIPIPPTLTPSLTPSPLPIPKSPGFEPVLSIAGLIAVAYLALRRKK